MLVRNLAGEIMKPYPAQWTSWIRSTILSILLTRGGLSVSFRGKGILVVLLCFVPKILEACTIAGVSFGLFKMPIEFSFSLGFALSTLAGAVIVPAMLSFNERGLGKSKGIPTSTVAASTFDTIICIIMYGIMHEISISKAEEVIT